MSTVDTDSKVKIPRLLSIIAWSFLAAIFFYCQKLPFHTAVLAEPYLTLAAIIIGVAIAFSPLSAMIHKAWNAFITLPSRIFMPILFFSALLTYMLVAKELFSGIPRLDDGVGALFEAHILAQFRTTLSLPPAANFYETFGVLGSESHLGHWCGMYPPGWPALLTLGVWVGEPWIIAPILGALLSLTIIALGTEMFGSLTGRIAGLLSIASPFIFILSGLHLSHIPTGLFCTLCLLFLLKMLRTNRWQYGLMAGLAIGLALLCRPVTAAVMGAVFGFLLLFKAKALWRNILGLVAAAIALSVCIAIYLLFQYKITGDPFLAGHTIGMSVLGKYGFVELRPNMVHTVAKGIGHTILRIKALNDNILGWFFPSMVIAVLPFILNRNRIKYFLLLLPALALLAVYCGFWYYEGYFPARYICAAVPLLIILCAHSLVLISSMVKNAKPILQRLYSGFIYANILFALIISIPTHLNQYDSHFGDVENNLQKTMKFYGVHNAVVFMDSINIDRSSHEELNCYYATGFMLNDLELKNDIIYVRNSRDQNHKITPHYPGRNFYLYRYERNTGNAVLYKATLRNRRFRYTLAIAPKTDNK